MGYKLQDHYEKPIPSGEYFVEITDLVEDVSRVKRTSQYNLTLTILSGAYAGRTVRHVVYITEKTLPILAQMFVNFKVPMDSEWDIESAQETWEILKEKRALATMSFREVKGFPNTEVDRFKPLTAEQENMVKALIVPVLDRSSEKDFAVRNKLDEEGTENHTSDDGYGGSQSSATGEFRDGDIPF